MTRKRITSQGTQIRTMNEFLHEWMMGFDFYRCGRFMSRWFIYNWQLREIEKEVMAGRLFRCVRRLDL